MVRLISCFSLVILLLLAKCGAAGAAHHISLTQLKVAYVYNFTKFTQLPDSVWTTAGQPFRLCIYGAGDVSNALPALNGKPLGERQIIVAKPKAKIDFLQCNALYLDGSEYKRFSYILDIVHDANVLTVSDHPEFIQQGGLIQLLEQQGKLRFMINLPRLQHVDLRLSSKLIKVAVRVKEEG